MGGGLFAFEELESFVDQSEKFLGVDLHLVGGNHGVVYPGHEKLFARLLGQRVFIVLEKAPFPGDGFDDAQPLQLGIGFGDGIAIHAQFLGQRSNGRERIAMSQSPGSGGITDLIDQLEINRFAGFKIDAKDHALTVIGR